MLCVMSNKLVSKRTKLKGILTRAAKFGADSTLRTPLSELKARDATVELTYRQIVEIHTEVEAVTGAEELEFQQIEMVDIETIYYNAKSSLIALIDLIEYNTVQQRLVRE